MSSFVNKYLFIISLIACSLISTSYLSNPKPESRIAPSVQSFGIRTVVIDAGHGGKDPGCLGEKYKEKDAALAIALMLGRYIEKYTPDVKVVYTRKTDIFVDLDERAAIANRNKADLFICIHCNAARDKDPHGSETFVMGLHKSNANLNVAKRENASILLEKNYQKRYDGFDPNSETGYILLTMQQSSYLKQSLNFAAKVQKQLKEKAGRIDKGVQQAGFLVLWRTSMPGVLIETEFLTNPESEKMLSSKNGQDLFAKAIFNAFRHYKDEVEGKLTKYDDEIEITHTSSNQIKDTTYSNETTVKNKTENNKKEIKPDTVIKKNSIIQSDDKSEITSKDTTVALPVAKDDSYSVSVILPVAKDDTSNLIYRIQFLISSQRIPLLSEKFKGIKNVNEYKEGAIYKYTAGEFNTNEDATKYKTEMQQLGKKDCFIVKFKNGVRIK